MKKITITILALILSEAFCYSQDIILKKTGEEISARILEIRKTEIVYTDFANQEGATLILPTSEIFMIRYKNGTKDVFTEEEAGAQGTDSEEELIMKGRQDATLNYMGKKSGAGWTAATTILLTPLIGVIPAAACASSEPATQNLNYNDNQLMEDPTYSAAYTRQAHKIKRKKVWRSFGISSGAWLLIILLL